MRSETHNAAQEWRAHWPTVLASAVGMSFSTLYVYSAGAPVEPLEQEFGWSRAAIGSGLTVLTFTGALLGPAMGMAVDRFGSRRLAVPGIFAFCLAFAAISLTGPSLWSWWLLWCLLALCGVGVKPACGLPPSPAHLRAAVAWRWLVGSAAPAWAPSSPRCSANG